MWKASAGVACGLVAISLVFGWNHPVGIILVLLGTVMGVWQSFPAAVLLGTQDTLTYPPQLLDTQTLSNWLLAIQDHERKHGLLALQQAAQEAPSPILAKGLAYLADNRPPEWIRHQLTQLADHYQRQWLQSIQVLECAAGLAPTMGILGALAALMLTQGQLKPGDVAPAFTATFLGVGLANLVLLPLAHRIQWLADQQAQLDDKWIDGLLSIQAGEHRLLLLDRIHPEQAMQPMA
jgi:chemotaxis protein MotA